MGKQKSKREKEDHPVSGSNSDSGNDRTAGSGICGYGLSPEVLMLVSAAIAGVIAIYLGYTWDEIMDSIVAKLSKQCRQFLF